MNTDFNFYYSGVAETALKLHNSAGNSKLRLHLFGNQVDDRFAVAAEKTDKIDLNWFERRFYVLVPDPSSNGATFYKVNKNSLKKRFQITNKELETGSLLDLMKEKHAARLAWEQMKGPQIRYAVKDPMSEFSRIIDALVEAGIDHTKYKVMALWIPGLTHYCFTADGSCGGFSPKEKQDNRESLGDYEKGEILTFICYPFYHRYQSGIIDSYNIFKNDDFINVVDLNDFANPQERIDFIKGANSPLTIINLDKDGMEKVMSKGKFPSDLLKQF